MDIQNLLTLQEEDGRLRDLQREIKVLLPKRRADAKARLQVARDSVEAATKANLEALREVERFQRDYTRHSARMSLAEQKAIGMTHARALDAAQSELDAASAAASAAESSAISASQALTPTERALDRARAFEAEEEVAVQAIYDAIEARKALVEEEITKVTARRDACVADVPAAQLRYYERLRLTRWPCVVPYNRTEHVCTGCNLVQPPSVTQAVLLSDKSDTATPATCPSCGRILI